MFKKQKLSVWRMIWTIWSMLTECFTNKYWEWQLLSFCVRRYVKEISEPWLASSFINDKIMDIWRNSITGLMIDGALWIMICIHHPLSIRYPKVLNGKLIIAPTQKSDSGVYICVASNTVGVRESQAARLAVLGKSVLLVTHRHQLK